MWMILLSLKVKKKNIYIYIYIIISKSDSTGLAHLKRYLGQQFHTKDLSSLILLRLKLLVFSGIFCPMDIHSKSSICK